MSKGLVVGQKTIFKAELFEVKEIEIELSNGSKKIHHIAERRPTVSVFPITDLYDIYLVSQYRYLFRKVTLESMAGFINTNESPLQAAKRELEEETGLVASHWEELQRVELAASVFKASIYIFLAKDLEQRKQRPDESEDITVVKLPLSLAVEKVISGEINHASSIIGILLLDRLRKLKKI